MDIKLEHIVLDANFNIKLIDFNFSCQVSSFCDERKGTLQYMTPEMHMGQKYSPIAADLFSLGVLLFILYTGVQPFSKATLKDSLYKLIAHGRLNQFWQCHESRPNCPPLSAEFKDLMSYMLAY